MNIILIKCLGFGLLIACNIIAQYPATLRLMTYNINAEAHAAGSYADIATVINEIKPVICGLQKVDSCNSRNSNDVLKWLSEQTGMTQTFAPAIKNYQGSTGAYGVGFLTNEPPLKVRKLWIEHTQSEQDRGALEISITIGGEPVRIIVTHLAHEGVSYRTAQLQKIISWIDSSGKDDPVIIMADFNAAPTENSMKQLETAGFNYVKGADGSILDTSSGQKINHIVYRPAGMWSVVQAGNPSYSASNRNPVWADMKLTAETSKNVSANIIHNDKAALKVHRRRIECRVGFDGPVSLAIYTLNGQKQVTILNNEYKKAGEYYYNFSDLLLSKQIYSVIYSDTRKVEYLPVFVD